MLRKAMYASKRKIFVFLFYVMTLVVILGSIMYLVEGEKSGFVADVVFGPRGSDAVFGSVGNSSEMVNQLYAYYNLADGVTTA